MQIACFSWLKSILLSTQSHTLLLPLFILHILHSHSSFSQLFTACCLSIAFAQQLLPQLYCLLSSSYFYAVVFIARLLPIFFSSLLRSRFPHNFTACCLPLISAQFIFPNLYCLNSSAHSHTVNSSDFLLPVLFPSLLHSCFALNITAQAFSLRFAQ